MNKRLTLLAATIAALSAPAFAAPTLEVYGKINVTLQSSEVQDGENSDGSKKPNKTDSWEVKSNASRFGLKGELAIEDEFAAFYQLEWEVDTADNDKTSKDHIKSRNQIVGLKGGFGKVFAGRHDTPLKMIQNKVDLFNDLDGDFKGLFNGEVRANNMAQYSSPKWGGFGFNIASLMQEKVDTDTSMADDDQDSLFDVTSISFEWSNKDLYIALAQDNNYGFNSTAAVNGNSWIDGAKTTRLVGQYMIGPVQIGAMMQKFEEGEIAGVGIDSNKDGEINSNTGKFVSVGIKVGENGMVKLQTGSSDINTKGGKQSSIGYDHKLGKNITWLSFFTAETRDADNHDKSYLGTGLEVKF